MRLNYEFLSCIEGHEQSQYELKIVHIPGGHLFNDFYVEIVLNLSILFRLRALSKKKYN